MNDPIEFHRLTGFEPLGTLTAKLSWDNGEVRRFDFRPMIDKSLTAGKTWLKPLLNADVFAKGWINERGGALTFGEDLDLDCEALRRRARIADGVAMTPEAFKEWRKSLKMSQAQAGEALGLSGRTIARIEKSHNLVSTTITLAVAGYNARRHAAE